MRLDRQLIGLGCLAGLAGSLAEVLWILLYTAGSGASAIDVARAVAVAATAGHAATAMAGVTIHLLLGAALGIALAAGWRLLPLPRSGAATFTLALTALAAVWKLNFFVVLPLIEPSFVQRLPLAVTLASKLMFGLAVATVFVAQQRRAARAACQGDGHVE